jgi:hypothetical protein
VSTPDTPWKVAECGDVYSAADFCVATCWSDEDAKLIAAAPDLLEFAQQVVKFAADHSNFYLMAWAQDVVNKVEGKP